MCVCVRNRKRDIKQGFDTDNPQIHRFLVYSCCWIGSYILLLLYFLFFLCLLSYTQEIYLSIYAYCTRVFFSSFFAVALLNIVDSVIVVLFTMKFCRCHDFVCLLPNIFICVLYMLSLCGYMCFVCINGFLKVNRNLCGSLCNIRLNWITSDFGSVWWV